MMLKFRTVEGRIPIFSRRALGIVTWPLSATIVVIMFTSKAWVEGNRVWIALSTGGDPSVEVGGEEVFDFGGP